MTSHSTFLSRWGKVKQVLGQLSLYFSVVSMSGIIVTTWHTTISPILMSYGITPSIWWVIIILGVPFIILAVLEWTHGTQGYFNSFAQFFYTKDSELKKDIEELKREIHSLREEIRRK